MRTPLSNDGPPDAPLPDIVGDSPAMRKVFELTRLVAPTTASVAMINGVFIPIPPVAFEKSALPGRRAARASLPSVLQGSGRTSADGSSQDLPAENRGNIATRFQSAMRETQGRHPGPSRSFRFS